MKITAVTPILVSLPYDHGATKPERTGMGTWDTVDIIFVRVDTDAGITGWGEAFGHASTPVTMTAVRDVISRLAVGQDANDVAALMTSLTRRTQSMARSGPVAFALSGLDIALWDIAGKAAGKPVWKLLNGERAKPLKAYASMFRCNTPDAVGKVAAAAVARGYRHIKLHEHSVEVIRAARKAVGPEIELMVDTNCFWTKPEDVLGVCRQLEDTNISWLEEPLYPADSYDLMADLRRDSNIPIAAGENLGNVNDLRWMLAADAVDVVQPSVAKIGGVTELWKAMTLARQHGVRAVPHSPFLGPALVAAMHVISASTEDILCEHRFCDLEAHPLGGCVIARGGILQTPDAPGLGFEIDEAVLAAYRRA